MKSLILSFALALALSAGFLGAISASKAGPSAIVDTLTR